MKLKAETVIAEAQRLALAAEKAIPGAKLGPMKREWVKRKMTHGYAREGRSVGITDELIDLGIAAALALLRVPAPVAAVVAPVVEAAVEEVVKKVSKPRARKPKGKGKK